MMRVKFIVIGKTTVSYFAEGEKEYLKRLSKYCKLEYIVIPELKKFKNNIERLKEEEAKKILERILPSDTVILLEEKGKDLSSEKFAEFLQKEMNHSSGDMVFVIGGANGFADELKKKFSVKIRLSSMTFTHQMVRMIFLEQLYRGFEILKNTGYHK